MTLTPEQCCQYEKWLTEEGYKKYTSCLVSTEDYAYFKAYNHDDESGHSDYQIAYRFYDWTSYPAGKDLSCVVSIITGLVHRLQLDIDPEDICIEDVERIAKDFWEFCKQHNME